MIAKLLLVILLAGPWLCLSGCEKRTAAPNTTNTHPPELLLLAAASTTDVVTELADQYQTSHNVTVKISTGGSNALASQIIAGAPGDVFLSANVQWASAVVQKGLAVDQRMLLANRLVIVVPKGNPAQIKTPADLLNDRVTHVALASEKVPAGIYATQALTHQKLYSRLAGQHRIVHGQDVRFTLAYVETGEAQAGIVYATDARISSKVQVAYVFRADSHDPILYPLVLLKSTENDAAQARAFFDYLGSPQAMAVFKKYGFSPAPSEDGITP